jgi:hypothetical protein
VLTQKDIQRREEEILTMLPKALIRHGGFQTPAELESIRSLLYSWFEGDPRFEKSARILSLMRFGAFRFLLRMIARIYVAVRSLRRRSGAC